MKKIGIEELKAKISYEEFYDVFVKQDKSYKEIMEFYKISKNNFYKLCHEYNINKNDLNTIVLDINLIKKLYIYENRTLNEIIKKLDISLSCLTRFLKKNNIRKPGKLKAKRAKETYKNKTGYDNPSQNPEIKNKKQETCLKNTGYKTPLECPDILNKMHVDYYNKTGYKIPAQNPAIAKKMSNTYYNKTGYTNPIQNPKTLEKILISKKIHGTTKTSKPEEYIYRLLIIKFPQTQRQYKSDLYPFACDFYIPECDLYIEYQGHLGHGKEPFDQNNQKHIEILNEWKERAKIRESKLKKRSQYTDYINVWTHRDPLKRRTAKENNLNWLEFFNLNQFLEWYKTQSGTLLLEYKSSIK